MSKAYYMWNPHLHHFPKFQSAIRHLQVVNRDLVPALLVIPLLLKINGHKFEVYTLVSEIQDKMDLILGVKNVFELESIMKSHTSSFHFLNYLSFLFHITKSNPVKWPTSGCESPLLNDCLA